MGAGQGPKGPAVSIATSIGFSCWLSPLGYLELKFPMAGNDFPDVILTKSLRPGAVLIQEAQEINIFEVPSRQGSPPCIHQN